MTDELPDFDPRVLRGFATDTARALRSAAEEIERLRGALSYAEAEARRYAMFYPHVSDGRNTFVLLADAIAEIANAKVKS